MAPYSLQNVLSSLNDHSNLCKNAACEASIEHLQYYFQSELEGWAQLGHGVLNRRSLGNFSL